MEAIAGAATLSPGGDSTNQDRVAVYRAADGLGGAGVVVCDGVGSYAGSGAVAAEVAATASEHLAKQAVGPGFWSLSEVVTAGPLEAAGGATTLIAVGADQTGLAGHAFVGNGSLIELVPYKPRAGVLRLRWADLALPQISWDDGRPALRSFLPAPPDDFETVLGFRAAAGRPRPRMYLACTDGIATDEERPGAQSPNGTYWKEVPRALVRVIEDLERQWPALLAKEEELATEALGALLERSLATLLDDGVLDDDASVACVLLRPRRDGGSW